MVSFLFPVTPLCVLLLVCRPFFHQAQAANTLETLEQVAIIAGVYYTDAYPLNLPIPPPNMTVTEKPLDIPALNEYLPLLFERKVNGDLDRAGIHLFYSDGQILYHNFTDIDEYKTNIQNNLESITFDFLPPVACVVGEMRVNDDVTQNSECDTAGFNITFIFSCTSMTVIEEAGQQGKLLTQLQQLPLPDSWLDGVDGCVNPCGY